MSVFYRKYQNQNQNSKSYGKWFGRAVTLGKTVELADLAKHMAEHNTPYSKGAITGVLTDMVNCIRELVLEGKAVKLPNLAIFSAGVQSSAAETSEDFSTTKNIKSVYLRARATGEFTRQELTKAGNVTELPKNFTDYKEDGDTTGTDSGSSSGGTDSGSTDSGGTDSGSSSGGTDSGSSSGGTDSGSSGTGED